MTLSKGSGRKGFTASKRLLHNRESLGGRGSSAKQKQKPMSLGIHSYILLCHLRHTDDLSEYHFWELFEFNQHISMLGVEYLLINFFKSYLQLIIS